MGSGSAWLIAAVFICALPATVAAQKPENHLYAFVGPGKFGHDRTTYGALGVEHIGSYGAGVGLELGFLSGVGPFRGNEHAQTTSSININLVVSNPDSRSDRVTPFFLAGLMFLENPTTDTELAFQVGGGVNVWVKPHMALRLDLRLPIGLTQDGGGSAGLGLTIR